MSLADGHTLQTSTHQVKARITAIGGYVPERKLTNADFESMVDTNDQWIVERTGIRERRICAPEQNASSLCNEAVRNMLKRYSVTLEDTDMVIVCTSTPDFAFPSTASLVQHEFGIKQAGTMDLTAACAGFVLGLHTAFGLISAGFHRKILVIGADALSKITDYTDRTTCILFGDGAGAVLVEATGETSQESGLGEIHYVHGSDGSGGVHIYQSRTASTLQGQPVQANGRIVQNGREVYRFAVQTVPRGVNALLTAAGIPATNVDWFIPHSANLRIIESICEKTGIPLERALHTIEYYGNTSAATIPLALDQGIRSGSIKHGDQVLLYGFGGGLVHAGMLLRWRDIS